MGVVRDLLGLPVWSSTPASPRSWGSIAGIFWIALYPTQDRSMGQVPLAGAHPAWGPGTPIGGSELALPRLVGGVVLAGLGCPHNGRSRPWCVAGDGAGSLQTL